AQITKKSFGGSSGGPAHTWGGGGSSALLRNHQPAHPFIQDPAMPPLPPPNTLAQLEEACRRLEEVSTKPSKQRTKEARKTSASQSVMSSPSVSSGGGGGGCGEAVVTYFFCGEEIPYRRSMKSHSLTLGHFKEQLRKKGNYRTAAFFSRGYQGNGKPLRL
ncbi:hypothetical protein CRUP_006458, partial [Coryphaenoides rupestris]